MLCKLRFLKSIHFPDCRASLSLRGYTDRRWCAVVACRLATASKPGGSPMDAQVGGAPVAPEAVKAAADAAKTAPTSFAPSANPGASAKTAGGGSQGGSAPLRGSSTAGESKAQPTASTPSAAELEKAASKSRISQGAAVRCAEGAYRALRIWIVSTNPVLA